MKAIILAALLALSTSVLADNHVWFGVATHVITGEWRAGKYDQSPDSEINKQHCLKDAAEIYSRLVTEGIEKEYELKCTQTDPRERRE
jgi:hypothetical protein